MASYFSIEDIKSIEDIPWSHGLLGVFKYEDYIQPINQSVFRILDGVLTHVESNNALIGKNYYTDWNNPDKNSVILDIGCNIGNLLITSVISSEFSSNYSIDIPPSRYIGIDVQEKPLSLARSFFPDYSFYQCDDYQRVYNKNGKNEKSLDKLLQEENIPKFQVILCHGLFNNFDTDEISAMVKTVKKSLTDDGIFIFSWWPFDKISPVVTHFNEKFSMDIPESVIQEYTDKDCVYLLNRKTVAHTIDEINKIENLDWIESFFSVECLKNIIGNFTLPTLDFFTYHKIGYIFKNDIID